jgi:hypothetical protein
VRRGHKKKGEEVIGLPGFPGSRAPQEEKKWREQKKYLASKMIQPGFEPGSSAEC